MFACNICLCLVCACVCVCVYLVGAIAVPQAIVLDGLPLIIYGLIRLFEMLIHTVVVLVPVRIGFRV